MFIGPQRLGVSWRCLGHGVHQWHEHGLGRLRGVPIVGPQLQAGRKRLRADKQRGNDEFVGLGDMSNEWLSCSQHTDISSASVDTAIHSTVFWITLEPAGSSGSKKKIHRESGCFPFIIGCFSLSWVQLEFYAGNGQPIS